MPRKRPARTSDARRLVRREWYDADRPHDEHAGHGDDQSPHSSTGLSLHAGIQTECEVQQDETGRNRQQVSRDIDAVAQIEFDKEQANGRDRGRQREYIDQQQRQAVEYRTWML